MKNDYYSGTYIPGIVKWGKITLLLGIFAGFLPALVMAFPGLYASGVRHYRRTPDADQRKWSILHCWPMFLFPDSGHSRYLT